jgi:hypothetical protein
MLLLVCGGLSAFANNVGNCHGIRLGFGGQVKIKKTSRTDVFFMSDKNLFIDHHC